MESKQENSFGVRERKLLQAAAVGIVRKFGQYFKELGEHYDFVSWNLYSEASKLANSIMMGASKVEDIGEVKQELSKVALPSDTSADQAQSDLAQELAREKQKLKALEEYGLKVDHLRYPPPRELGYLFVKSKGKFEYQDRSIPEVLAKLISGGDRRPLLPYFNYQGDLINGVPSGKGTIDYGDIYLAENEYYGCSYTGGFLNGMKHGEGQASAIGSGKDLSYEREQEECRYSQDKRSGIFLKTEESHYEVCLTTTQLIANEKQQFVSIESGKKERRYRDIEGNIEITLHLDGQNVTVKTPKEGETQGITKQYVLA